jgi:hypothetical protein
MTITTIEGKSLCEQLAENYKRTLPTKGKNQYGATPAWTIERFATWVSLRYPEVRVVEGQEWKGNKTKYQLLCEEHGEFETTANHILKLNTGNNCRKCSDERTRNSTGKVQRQRATPEEVQQTTDLYNELGNQREVARRMGRSLGFVQSCLNPEYKQRRIEVSRAHRQSPEAKQRAKETSAIFRQTPHGKQSIRQASNKRRALEWEASFSVLIDDVWHEVEMYDCLQDWDDRQMFVEFQSCEDYAKLQAIAKEMELEHGEEFHIDHLVPLSRGGLHHTHNFKIVPASYNLSKNNKRIHEDEALFCKRIFGIN